MEGIHYPHLPGSSISNPSISKQDEPVIVISLHILNLCRSFYLVSPNTSELRLPLEKRYHQAELTCHVNNKALDQPLSTSRTLNIQCKKRKIKREQETRNAHHLDKPEVNLRHGLAQVTNLNLLVVENDRLTLDCQAQSNPSISEPMTWLKNGASMTGRLIDFAFDIGWTSV